MFYSSLDILQELDINTGSENDKDEKQTDPHEDTPDFSTETDPDEENPDENTDPNTDTPDLDNNDKDLGDDPHEDTPDFSTESEPEEENPDENGDTGTDDNLSLDDDSDPHEDTPDFGSDNDDGDQNDDPHESAPDFGDDTGNPDDTSDPDATTDDVDPDTQNDLPVTDEEIKDLENKVFSGLSDNDKRIRILELKGLFNDLYLYCEDVEEKINNISKTDDNISIFKRVIDTIEKIKEFIKFYIENKFDNATYFENEVVFNKYLSILSGIKNVLGDLNNKNSIK